MKNTDISNGVCKFWMFFSETISQSAEKSKIGKYFMNGFLIRGNTKANKPGRRNGI